MELEREGWNDINLVLMYEILKNIYFNKKDTDTTGWTDTEKKEGLGKIGSETQGY